MQVSIAAVDMLVRPSHLLSRMVGLQMTRSNPSSLIVWKFTVS